MMDNSQIFLAFILGTVIILLFALSLIVFLIHHKRKQQLHINEKINLQHRFETQLLTTRLEVQEQAFQNFSEEIHDNVGQQLTVCKLLMHQLAQHTSNTEDSELLHQATDIITSSLSDLRNISHVLNGNMIARAGLVECLEREVKYISAVRKVKSCLAVQGEPVSLSQDKELLIFRIVQEAVSNALKHAQPTMIKINLDYQFPFLTVEISDDGIGFEVGKNNDGIGLINIKQRVTLLKGTVDITSIPQKGTTIHLKIDISNGH